LTGESVPVSKQTEPLDAEIALAERTDMAFKGTSVTSGSGKGLVTATGMSNELGDVASLVEEAEEEETPLEKRLERLGYRLIWVTLGIALVLILSGNVAVRDPREPILTNRHWGIIGAYGAVLACSVLVAFWIAFQKLGLRGTPAVTVSFLTLAFGRLWHVFNMREADVPPILKDITRNPFVWGVLGLCTALLLAAVMAPGLALVLELGRPDVSGWWVILGMSLAPLLILQPLKILAKRTRGR
ncbi:MAG: cation transporting ATPase C-terminal domain-containing protein, partial [Desulfatiglandales bacterium]